MAAVTWHLAQAAFVDALTVALGVLAILILVKTRVNSALLIIAGGLAGLVAGVMGR